MKKKKKKKKKALWTDKRPLSLSTAATSSSRNACSDQVACKIFIKRPGTIFLKFTLGITNLSLNY